MRQVVLDTETTGLSAQEGHRIIEIGCVELLDRRETGHNFHVYINPRREVDEGALAVHGLSNDFLQSKPLFEEVIQSFWDYIGGCEVLIHNAPFDVAFLNHELSLLPKHTQPFDEYSTIVDTLALARAKHPGVRNSLDALCRRYSVDNSSRELHGALLDASLLAKVYLAMTGGQFNLFAGDKDAQHCQEMSEHREMNMSKTDWQVPIQQASAQELEAHSVYLINLAAESAGECLWGKLSDQKDA